jgi:hypothetical protein
MGHRFIARCIATSLFALAASVARGQAGPPLTVDPAAPSQQCASSLAALQQFNATIINSMNATSISINQGAMQSVSGIAQIKAPYAREYQQYVAEMKKNGPPTAPKGSKPVNPADLVAAKKAQLLQKQAVELAKMLDHLNQQKQTAMDQLRKQKSAVLAQVMKLIQDCRSSNSTPSSPPAAETMNAQLSDVSAAYDQLLGNVEIMFSKLTNQVKSEMQSLDAS